MSKPLPSKICQLLESCISERKFRVKNEGAYLEFYAIKAGRTLGPPIYIYIAHLPTTGTIADDNVIIAVHDCYTDEWVAKRSCCTLPTSHRQRCQ